MIHESGTPIATAQPRRLQGGAARNLRRRMLTAFRRLGHGVDAPTARQRMHAFYRSSGAAWARGLA